MDFCNGGGDGGFQSSVIQGGGGTDPSVMGWGAKRINVSMADVQQSIQEGRMAGTGVWSIEGNPQIGPNN